MKMFQVSRCRSVAAVHPIWASCTQARQPRASGRTVRFSTSVAPFQAQPKRTRMVPARAWGDDIEFSPAKILQNVKAAANMHIVTVDVGQEISAGYTKGGQFLQMKVGDSKPAFLAIASAPAASKDGTMEFLIKFLPDSTAGLVIGLSAGDNVQVSPVMGKGFPVESVPPDIAETMLIFATGSGISPIKALIDADALSAKNRKDVRLYYGTTDIDSMAYADRIPEWEDKGVKVIKVFSKRGQGYVQDVYAKGEGLQDASKTCVFLCGQKDMAFAVKELLSAQGVPDSRFITNF